MRERLVKVSGSGRWMLSRKAWKVALWRISAMSNHNCMTGSMLEIDVSLLGQPLELDGL